MKSHKNKQKQNSWNRTIQSIERFVFQKQSGLCVNLCRQRSIQFSRAEGDCAEHCSFERLGQSSDGFGKKKNNEEEEEKLNSYLLFSLSF